MVGVSVFVVCICIYMCIYAEISPLFCATNAFARITSRVVTPNSLKHTHNDIRHHPNTSDATCACVVVWWWWWGYFAGLYTPAFLNTSAQIGTVELTGLEMIHITASGATLRNTEEKKKVRCEKTQ